MPCCWSPGVRGALAEARWRGVGRRSHPPPPPLGLMESGTEIKGISLTLGPVIRKLFTDLEDRDSVSREGVTAEGPGECLASQGSPLSPAACMAPGCRHLWSLGASSFPLPAPPSRLDPLCLHSPRDPLLPWSLWLHSPLSSSPEQLFSPAVCTPFPPHCCSPLSSITTPSFRSPSHSCPSYQFPHLFSASLLPYPCFLP